MPEMNTTTTTVPGGGPDQVAPSPDDEPLPVANRLQKAIRLFERAMSGDGQKTHIERVDKVKQLVDDWIEGAFKSTNGRQRYLGGKLEGKVLYSASLLWGWAWDGKAGSDTVVVFMLKAIRTAFAKFLGAISLPI